MLQEKGRVQSNPLAEGLQQDAAAMAAKFAIGFALSMRLSLLAAAPVNLAPEQAATRTARAEVLPVRHEPATDLPRVAEARHCLPASASRHNHRKAFLSYKSIHGRYYYTKVRTAKGRGARDAYAAACGMRWNFYLCHGKHTPHFVSQEHHKTSIVNGLLRNMEHERGTAGGKQGEEARTYQHACSHHEIRTSTQSTGTEFGQTIQTTHATAAVRGAQDSPVQGSNGPHAQVFPGVLSISTAPEPAGASRQHTTVHMHLGAGHQTAAQAAPVVVTAALHAPVSDVHNGRCTHSVTGRIASHAAALVQTAQASGTVPVYFSFTSAQTGTQSRQMDISLIVAFDPRSQMSYAPTYQVGAYAASGFAASQTPAMNFSQGVYPAASQGAAKQSESAYFESGKRKMISLKVAQAAATPE
jgi:hypothetical protein